MGTMKPSISGKKKKTLLSELKRMTRGTLYRCAQALGIPGRSTMKKSDLVEALEEKREEVQPMIASIQGETTSMKKSSVKKVTKSDTITTDSKKVLATHDRLPEIPKEKQTIAQEESLTSDSGIAPVQEPTSPPSDTVWVGEEGPELPHKYGVTVLRALVRDPHWIYLYWEISDAVKESLRREKGEWIFDVAEAYLRVFNEKGECVQEIPVLLDAMSWYISLSSNKMYGFELGVKDHQGDFHVLASSNPVSLPADQPSQLKDEEWSVVEEQFSEMLHDVGGFEFSAASGSSANVLPHILRNRMRVPWNFPSSEWPSSHLMAAGSMTMQKKK